MFPNNGEIGGYQCFSSAHKQLEIEINVKTCVAVSAVVCVGCHGDVEKEKVVIEVRVRGGRVGGRCAPIRNTDCTTLGGFVA